MKKYLKLISFLQESLIGGSILILCFLPLLLVFYPEQVNPFINTLFAISLISVTFVMAIRPLADLIDETNLIRPLVILRKGFGILSASIIVSFIFSKIIIGGNEYFHNYVTSAFWNIQDLSLFAHLGDITGFILLITSNVFSKRVLGKNWKRIQKLAYVYFYSGALYEFLSFQSKFALFALILVTGLVLSAYIKNKFKKYENRKI